MSYAYMSSAALTPPFMPGESVIIRGGLFNGRVAKVVNIDPWIWNGAIYVTIGKSLLAVSAAACEKVGTNGFTE